MAVPLAPGEALQAGLFGAVDRVVLTSATLSAGGDFDHLLAELGLGTETTETLAVPCRDPLLLPGRLDLPDPGGPVLLRSRVAGAGDGARAQRSAQ